MSLELNFKNVLVVEDGASLLQTIEIALTKMGLQPSPAMSLAQAQEKFKSEIKFDLILLDRNLPDGDGLDFCRSIRDQGYTGAVLVLTAAGKTHERVDGLNAGADDYLPKPFSWDELDARIRALSRRWGPLINASNALSSGNSEGQAWEIDEDQRRIRGTEDWVHLTQLEFKLARELITQQPRILTRKELLKKVWGFEWLPKTRTVDFFIVRLRKHFEIDPEKPRHFITVRGSGYRFDPQGLENKTNS